MLHPISRPKNSNATLLTKDNCKEIRDYYSTGELKINALSKRYACGTRRIIDIIKGGDQSGGYIQRHSEYDTKKVDGGSISSPTDNNFNEYLDQIRNQCSDRLRELQQRHSERLNSLIN